MPVHGVCVCVHVVITMHLYMPVTGVTSRVVINKFHVVKNNSTNVHVLEFGPSYDVKNRVDKAVTVSCYMFDCPSPKRTLGRPQVTLFGLR